MSGRLRFAAVISHPIQHFSPIFSRLACDPGLEVRAIYLTDHGVRAGFDPGFNASFAWDVDLVGGHGHEFLRPGFTPQHFGFRELDSPAVVPALERFQPHALWLHGYGSLVNLRALAWARKQAAVVYFGDSELRRPRRAWVRAAKAMLLPAIFQRCDAVVTVGDCNEAYYRHYGVSEAKLFRGACPIDVPRFSLSTEQALAARAATRQRYGIPEEAFVALTSGKLDSNKRPLDVVAAVAQLRGRTARPVHALLVGDGVLRGAVESAAAAAGVADRVCVSGFVNQSELPLVLHAGDVLVQASERDAHPLSVTEGLAAGLPVVIADGIGCIGPTDTARPGVNATVFPCGDVVALADALARLAQDEPLRARQAAASRAISPTQDIAAAAQAVKRALAALQPRFAAQWSEVDPTHFEHWRAGDCA